MQRITKDQAISAIKHGFYVKCEVSRQVFKVIHSLDELEYYQKLANVQGFNLYGFSDEEIASYKIPDGAFELTVDQAYLLCATKVVVNGLVMGEKEYLLRNLQDFKNFLGRCRMENIPFLLYQKSN